MVFLEDTIKTSLDKYQQLETSEAKNLIFQLEVRECIMWCLNIYIEIISPNSVRLYQVDVDVKKYETDVTISFYIKILDYL